MGKAWEDFLTTIGNEPFTVAANGLKILGEQIKIFEDDLKKGRETDARNLEEIKKKYQDFIDFVRAAAKGDIAYHEPTPEDIDKTQHSTPWGPYPWEHKPIPGSGVDNP